MADLESIAATLAAAILSTPPLSGLDAELQRRGGVIPREKAAAELYFKLLEELRRGPQTP
jgi:hypothetical protein